jgi:hypothetical protein
LRLYRRQHRSGRFLNRIVDHRYSEVIGAALSHWPPLLLDFVGGVDWLTGTDPIFAGLHQFESTVDGRSYRRTAHAVYPYHQAHAPASQRVPTVVLPTVPSVHVVVHELAHVLHWRLAFEPVAQPVTEYAATNWCEAFAEAVTTWLLPGYATARVDRRTAAQLEALASANGP